MILKSFGTAIYMKLTGVIIRLIHKHFIDFKTPKKYVKVDWMGEEDIPFFTWEEFYEVLILSL